MGSVVGTILLLAPTGVLCHLLFTIPLSKCRKFFSKVLIGHRTLEYDDQSVYAYENFRYRVYGTDLPDTYTFYYLHNPRHAYTDYQLRYQVTTLPITIILAIVLGLQVGKWCATQEAWVMSQMPILMEWADNLIRTYMG